MELGSGTGNSELRIGTVNWYWAGDWELGLGTRTGPATGDSNWEVGTGSRNRGLELQQELGIETGSWTKELGTGTRNSELGTRTARW